MKYLIPLLFPLTVLADSQITGNLVTNGTFEGGNSNGWTTTGEVMVLNDCCGSNYDLEFGDSGSIEQSFNLITDTITQPMLNNGITLNSSVQVQNGECGVAQCWGGQGPADTFTIRLQIKDSNDNVLATTTQERTNVTGINGKDFTDSVSYTQSGSNRGNIFISGSDGNGVVGGLGGPNLDNIEVTMTYDDTVLTATESAIIATAFEEIEQVLSTEIETVEFTPIEEVTFEVYEEPEIVLELFQEIKIEELAKEEINTGIVNIFFEPLETMEITYEEPTTIEEISTEIESYEAEIEVASIGEEPEKIAETSNTSGITEREAVLEEVEGTGTGNAGAARENEETISAEPTEENTITETNSAEPVEQTEEPVEQSEEETVVASEEVTEEASETNRETETTESESGSETTETADSGGETLESGNEEVAESRDSENTTVSDQTISVENIERKVNETIKRVDQRLVATSLIVAKAIQNNEILNSYQSVNQDIFNNQPMISGGTYDETREYIDNRNIYIENQNSYNDPVAQIETKIQQATDEVIRAAEHLRRIRGY